MMNKHHLEQRIFRPLVHHRAELPVLQQRARGREQHQPREQHHRHHPASACTVHPFFLYSSPTCPYSPFHSSLPPPSAYLVFEIPRRTNPAAPNPGMATPHPHLRQHHQHSTTSPPPPTFPLLPRPAPPLRLRPLQGRVEPGPAWARVRGVRAHVGVGRGPRAGRRRLPPPPLLTLAPRCAPCTR
ncbi:hypothetical protein B0H11DRAFT_1317268 [Mycena galericulata]|nr:hypothetical protein B0H11DRAFT_1317268 [Mycena galericulata]